MWGPISSNACPACSAATALESASAREVVNTSMVGAQYLSKGTAPGGVRERLVTADWTPHVQSAVNGHMSS